jgi:hypothetical protein
MILVDYSDKLYRSIDAILQFFLNYHDSFVDIGCGSAPHTRNLTVHGKRLFIDLKKRIDSPEPFKEEDARGKFYIDYDVLIGLDFLEHLTKEEGYQFLIRACQANNFIILFCPEGEYIVPDAVGPDQHQCGWTAKEMSDLGFQVWLAPNFHSTLNLGAFLAWMSPNRFTLDFPAEDIFKLVGGK